jgi:hypothetical protein
MKLQAHEIFALGLAVSLGTGMRSGHELFEVRGNIRQIHNCAPIQEHDGGWCRRRNIEPENVLWSRPLDSDIPGPQTRYRNFLVNMNFRLVSAFISITRSSFNDNSPGKEYSKPESGNFFEHMNLEKRIHRRELLKRYENLAATTTSRILDFQPIGSRELNFRQRHIIEVLESVSKEWGKASLTIGTGTYPLHRVGKFSDSMREELQQQEAQILKEVFADVQSVKKLSELLMISSQPTEYKDKIKDKNEIEVSTMSNWFIQFR